MDAKRGLQGSNPAYMTRYVKRDHRGSRDQEEDLNPCKIHLIIPHGYTTENGEEEYRRFGDTATKATRSFPARCHAFITYTTPKQARRAVTQGNPIYRPRYAKAISQEPVSYPPPRQEKPVSSLVLRIGDPSEKLGRTCAKMRTFPLRTPSAL